MGIYTIRNLFPGERGEWHPGIHIDQDSAVFLRRAELTRRFEETMQADGREIITLFGLNPLGEIEHPYLFIEGSTLIQTVRVPGDACDLSLDESSRNDYIETWNQFQQYLKKPLQDRTPVNYMPHNVYSPEQAFALVSLFVNWANTAEICFLKDIIPKQLPS